MDKRMFGGNREAAIIRDGSSCVICGMNREQHRVTFGYDITVDHIDDNGSKKPFALKNNALENLQTLCVVCHARKDNRHYRLTDMQVINIRHMKGELTQEKIAALYGIGRSYVSEILNGKWRRNLLPAPDSKAKA